MHELGPQRNYALYYEQQRSFFIEVPIYQFFAVGKSTGADALETLQGCSTMGERSAFHKAKTPRWCSIRKFLSLQYRSQGRPLHLCFVSSAKAYLTDAFTIPVLETHKLNSTSYLRVRVVRQWCSVSGSTRASMQCINNTPRWRNLRELPSARRWLSKKGQQT